ncbi:MAG: hypothetical protein R2820_05665 [Cyclobacteriaceae bacterium]|nr:hypothetical protein [Cyclobacteriaceae bacterium]
MANQFYSKRACEWIFIIAVLLGCSKEESIDVPKPDCLLAQVAIEGQVNDVTTYVDDATGMEYALVGFGNLGPLSDNTGFSIIDTSDPSNPKVTAKMTSVGGLDLATWGHYVYAVGGEQGEAKIVDMDDPANPVVVGSFPDAFFITISESGLMILSLSGVAIYDLNSDPLHPVLLWSDDDSGGQETLVLGNTLYDFHEKKGTRIYDISDPSDPQLIVNISSLNIRYHHSGQATSDEKYLFINDEREEGSKNDRDFTVWDISNKAAPKLVGSFNDPESSVHNIKIIGNRAHFAYYASGYRIFDITDQTSPSELFSYDTSPAVTGNGLFVGAVGVAVGPSGRVYITDQQNGLFIFDDCAP